MEKFSEAKGKLEYHTPAGDEFSLQIRFSNMFFTEYH